MKLQIDKEAEALYLQLDDSAILESEKGAPGVVLDFNEADEIASIEMLHLPKRTLNLTLSPSNPSWLDRLNHPPTGARPPWRYDSRQGVEQLHNINQFNLIPD